MANMRIVGMNAQAMFIQKEIKGEWIQEVISFTQFEDMMKTEYPRYWNKYTESNTDKSAEDFFYNYGEDENMESKGESFIYKTHYDKKILKKMTGNCDCSFCGKSSGNDYQPFTLWVKADSEKRGHNYPVCSSHCAYQLAKKF